MITIARFSKPEDAHLMRLRLEAGVRDVQLHRQHEADLNEPERAERQ